MDSLYPAFITAVSRSRLIRPGDEIVCAFSGGKDSTALLCLLKRLQEEWDLRLRALYVNHLLRADHLEEEAWVRSFCSRRQIELIADRADVRKESERQKMNLEHCASLVRHRLYHAALERYPGAKLATAHTASDQAETFLIKLLRGSGSEGLSGIFPRRHRIIRPLIFFTHEVIQSFLDQNQIPFYRDPTNRDTRLLRNRIRHRLIPRLKKISPRLEDHIQTSCRILQKELSFFQRLARSWLDRRLLLNRILPLSPLLREDPALQAHILREYIRRVKGNLYHITSDHITTLLQPADAPQKLSLPGLELSRQKGYLFPRDLIIKKYRRRIALPEKSSEYPLRSIGSTLRVAPLQAFVKPPNHEEIIVPLSSLRFPLQVRPPRPGDGYRKLHTGFRQSVKEMIRQQGFPPALRNLCPLLVDGNGELIWCCGSAVAHPYRVRENSRPPYISFSLYRPGQIPPG